MDKYKQYILERENAHLYEDGVGFFTYTISDNIFQVNDLFILPEYRSLGYGKKYAGIIEVIAGDNNCDIICCFTCTDANNWKQSHRYILNNGYKIVNKNNTMICYKKEL